MSLSVEAIIPRLLMDHAKETPFSPELPIIEQETYYEPSVGSPYVELQYVSNITETPFVGNDDPANHQGFLQATVVAPRNEGIDLAMSYAATLVEHFQKGTILRGESVSVKIIRKPWTSGPISEPSWLRVPVSIPYVCIA